METWKLENFNSKRGQQLPQTLYERSMPNPESGPLRAVDSSSHKWPGGLQGYLAHKKAPTSLGPPEEPRHGSFEGSYGVAVSYERGTPVVNYAQLTSLAPLEDLAEFDDRISSDTKCFESRFASANSHTNPSTCSLY